MKEKQHLPCTTPHLVYQVGSTWLEDWNSQRYPDFVAEGTGDQKAIMGAICAVKKASFDGVDCVGGDDAATGTVRLDYICFRLCGLENIVCGRVCPSWPPVWLMVRLLVLHAYGRVSVVVYTWPICSDRLELARWPSCQCPRTGWSVSSSPIRSMLPLWKTRPTIKCCVSYSVLVSKPALLSRCRTRLVLNVERGFLCRNRSI